MTSLNEKGEHKMTVGNQIRRSRTFEDLLVAAGNIEANIFDKWNAVQVVGKARNLRLNVRQVVELAAACGTWKSTHLLIIHYVSTQKVHNYHALRSYLKVIDVDGVGGEECLAAILKRSQHLLTVDADTHQVELAEILETSWLLPKHSQERLLLQEQVLDALRERFEDESDAQIFAEHFAKSEQGQAIVLAAYALDDSKPKSAVGAVKFLERLKEPTDASMGACLAVVESVLPLQEEMSRQDVKALAAQIHDRRTSKKHTPVLMHLEDLVITLGISKLRDCDDAVDMADAFVTQSATHRFLLEYVQIGLLRNIHDARKLVKAVKSRRFFGEEVLMRMGFEFELQGFAIDVDQYHNKLKLKEAITHFEGEINKAVADMTGKLERLSIIKSEILDQSDGCRCPACIYKKTFKDADQIDQLLVWEVISSFLVRAQMDSVIDSFEPHSLDFKCKLTSLSEIEDYLDKAELPDYLRELMKSALVYGLVREDYAELRSAVEPVTGGRRRKKFSGEMEIQVSTDGERQALDELMRMVEGVFGGRSSRGTTVVRMP